MLDTRVNAVEINEKGFFGEKKVFSWIKHQQYEEWNGWGSLGVFDKTMLKLYRRFGYKCVKIYF